MANNDLPKVLIIVAFYPPAFKGGGPVRGVYNLVEQLGDRYDFTVLAYDRDLGDTEPFSTIVPDVFVRVGKAKVMYCSPRQRSPVHFARLLSSISNEIIVVNSFFGRGHSMYPLLLWKLGLIKSRFFLLAPRGEFSKGSLSIKPIKKRIWLWIIGRTGLYRNVCWLLTTNADAINVSRYFYRSARDYILKNAATNSQLGSTLRENGMANFYIIPDLFIQKSTTYPIRDERKKEQGTAKILHVSRISPEKNCLTALRALEGIHGTVEFNIFGPIDRPGYWEECKKIIADMPKNVTVKYGGAVAHEEVGKLFSAHHAFLFPTLGENFGYVILESLLDGCPAIISDQTPWKDLRIHNAGWVVPIDNTDAFTQALQQVINMDNAEFQEISSAAKQYGENAARCENAVRQYDDMFNALYRSI